MARRKTTTPALDRLSALIETRFVYCGENLDQLRKLPAACIHLTCVDKPINSNRNYEVFWGEPKEKRAYADRHASAAAYIEYMRSRCVKLSHYVVATACLAA